MYLDGIGGCVFSMMKEQIYIPFLPLVILYESYYGRTEAIGFMVVVIVYFAALIDSLRWLFGRLFN